MNERPVNRVTPQGPPHLYKTYQLTAPLTTHWRPATCFEVDCRAYLNGWTTTVDTNTELGRRQAAYIEADRTRRYECRADWGRDGVVAYDFERGQKCFAAASHRVQDREPTYRILGGDHRRYSGGQVLAERAWLDDFGEHLQHVAELHERG